MAGLQLVLVAPIIGLVFQMPISLHRTATAAKVVRLVLSDAGPPGGWIPRSNSNEVI
jgi:hypothetical protein